MICLLAARDEGLRSRLRRARAAQARPRDDQRVPQRPDRSAQGLPGLRRRRARRSPATTSSPAGPTASPSARTARSPTRSRRATSPPRSPPVCTTAAAPAAACTSTSRRSRPASTRCRRGCSTTRSTASSGSRTATARHARCRTARSAAPTRPRSTARCATTAGSRSRAGPTTSGRPWRAIIGVDDPESRDARRAASHGSTRSRPRSTRGPRTRTRAEVAEQLQAAGIEAVPVEDFGDLHDDPQLAHRHHFERAHAPVPWARGSTSATASGSRDAPGGYDRAGPDARPGQRLGPGRPARPLRRRAGDPRRGRRLQVKPNKGISPCRFRGSVIQASSQPFADVFAGRDLVGVVVEPSVELPARLLVGVEARVGGDLVVGIERRVIALRLAGHHRVDHRLQARGLGALAALVRARRTRA